MKCLRTDGHPIRFGGILFLELNKAPICFIIEIVG